MTDFHETPLGPIVVLLDRDLNAVVRLDRWVTGLDSFYEFRSDAPLHVVSRRMRVELSDCPLLLGEDAGEWVVEDRFGSHRTVRFGDCAVATLVDGRLQRWFVSNWTSKPPGHRIVGIDLAPLDRYREAEALERREHADG